MSDAVRISGGNTLASGTQAASSVTYPLEIRDTKSPGGSPAINRLLFVSVGARRDGGGPANTIAVTYNGITMTPAGTLASHTVGNNSIYSQCFYLLESQLPANGTYDVVATISGGGTNFAISSVGSSYANIAQAPPLFTANQQAAFATSVALSISHPTDSATFFAQTHRANPTISHSSSNTQIELADVGVAAGAAPAQHRHSATYTVNASSIGTPFPTATSPITSVDWTKSGATWDTVDDFTFLATSVSATSTVTVDILVPNEFAATVAVNSTTAAAMLRDRGYATTVPGTVVVTPVLERSVPYRTLAVQTANVSADRIVLESSLAATIEPVATITSAGGEVTRPLSALSASQLVVTPSFGNTFAETQYSPTPGDYVELFQIDTTVIGGGDVFRFIPHRFETPDLQVEWQGNTFIQFPVIIEGFEQQATGAAPPQPTMRVANVNKFILSAILELGDLVGAKVTRWRTYARFLDNGETPDPTAHYAPDIYYIQRKTAQTREGFEFVLSSALDLPGIKLPRRQVLKDQSSEERNLYAPGVANVRFRGR